MLSFARFGLSTLLGLALQASLVATAPYPFDVTELRAPDGSITVKFISLGSTMTELWVRDKKGKMRDIILGYDDNTKLLTDPAHPYFNPIVGRYANRIKNGTFSIPITKNPQPPGPNVFHIPENDRDGQVALHGGTVGWDRRNWTIVAKGPTSVTYQHIDLAEEGFPGDVTVRATHTVSNGGILHTHMHATANTKTPIMLAQHTYFNLDAFQDGTNDIFGHHLQVDASKVVAIDGNLIPTGEFIQVQGTPFDFRREQLIGARFNETVGLCGPGCQGYDHCWIYTGGANQSKVRTSVWSDKSGIRLDLVTDQAAVQVYTSNMLNVPRKVIHGGPNLNYSTWSAVAIEQEDYIDAINTPEWGINEIYGPNRPYDWRTTYYFSIQK